MNAHLCLGMAGLASPAGLGAPEQLIAFDMRVMVVVAIVLLPLIITDYTISRVEGVLLLSWSAIYLIWTVLAATDNPLLAGFSDIGLLVVFPATVVFITTTVASSIFRLHRK